MKTVDELRIKTNPKSSGNVICDLKVANSLIKTMGQQGKQEKIDQIEIEMTSDRLFTPSGGKRSNFEI